MDNLIITVCGGTGCDSQDSMLVAEEFKRLIVEQNLPIKVKRTGCQGFCEAGPIVTILPQKIFYSKVRKEDCYEVLESLKNNTIVDRLRFVEMENGFATKRTYVDEIDFYKHQKRLLLDLCGKIDPYDIDDYIAHGGFEQLKKAFSMKPEEVIGVVKNSGLRGRGGAGFLTGQKWEFISKAKGDKKYIVCNADEGDPGSFMDRTVLEGDPFAVVEGMIIAGFAVGATSGFVYCRAEKEGAIKVLGHALDVARQRGFLGSNILGSGFSLDIELKVGAGAFVCGEETALLNSIEGKRGNPRPRPPFPANKGLWGKPTNINNVKTYAYVPLILKNGAEWFRQTGTEKSPGTAVLSLTGKVNNSGLVEVPMGTSLHDVIFNIGGGIRNNRKFKAALTGGPSGGCIPETLLNLGVDYESLGSAGSIMGSGGVLILDEDDSMVDIANFFLDFTIAESCGKCTPCREGLKRMQEIIERIKRGEGKAEDLAELEKMGNMIKDTSLCGLGQTAPNPVLTTLRYFKHEYEALLNPHYKYFFITDKCIGCSLCKKNCPVQAISGEPKQRHIIHDDKCIGCGQCYRVCPVKAIVFNEKNLKADGKIVPEVRK